MPPVSIPSVPRPIGLGVVTCLQQFGFDAITTAGDTPAASITAGAAPAADWGVKASLSYACEPATEL